MATISIDTGNPQYRSDVQTLTRMANSMNGTLAILKKAPPHLVAAWLTKDPRLQAVVDLVQMFLPYISTITAAQAQTAKLQEHKPAS